MAKPVEECDLEPQKTCRHVTKLVPYLRAVEECVDVPQEVCGVSRVDPVKKKRPSIQWWCVDPEQSVPAVSTADKDPEQPPELAASTAEEDHVHEGLQLTDRVSNTKPFSVK